MAYKDADFTIGDVGVSLVGTVNEDISSKNIDFLFTKPSGASLLKDATSVATYTATYTWASEELDEAGDWRVSLYEADNGFYYQPSRIFTVGDKPEDMAI